MNTETWTERAERLRRELAELDSRPADVASAEKETLERATIARWLRAEFSDAPPEDTATLLLFREELVERGSEAAPSGMRR